MPALPLISMPFLHKELYPALFPPVALRLWPGLPKPPDGVYVPERLPLSPEQAARYAEEIQSLGASAAANAPVHTLLAEEKQKHRLAYLQENMDISAFAAGETSQSYEALRLREAPVAAQKLLVCTLLLEKRLLEIRALEHNYHELSEKFSAALGVEFDDGDADMFRLMRKTEKLSETDFVVPLDVLLENAGLLLPEHCALLFADPVAGMELRDAGLVFNPAPHLLHGTGITLATEQTVPLRQALGLSGLYPERPWLERRFRFMLWSAL